MLAGLLAGVLGFTFGRVFGESAVDAAIAFESYVEYDVHHEDPEPELVSRSLQSTAGLATGALIYGVALGGMFSLVFAASYGRFGRWQPVARLPCSACWASPPSTWCRS